MSKAPWWEKGVRFECQGSGKCCSSRGQYGYVYMDADDRRRMARSLKLPMAVFTRRYCRQTSGNWHLKGPNKDCEFLDGARCRVYKGRPKQCRTWPFWPEHMDARTWSREIKSFCPGIGKGRLYKKSEILKRLLQHEDEF
jgi:Fe-S-cluster containining protein